MKVCICLFCNKEFEHSYSSTNQFCSTKCSGNHKSFIHKESFWKGTLEKLPDRPVIRKYLAEARGYACEICKVSEWNNKPLTLQVDHINGKANDCSPNNLRLLCPNCHTQTDYYGGKNKGQGRRKLGMKLY